MKNLQRRVEDLDRKVRRFYCDHEKVVSLSRPYWARFDPVPHPEDIQKVLKQAGSDPQPIFTRCLLCGKFLDRTELARLLEVHA